MPGSAKPLGTILDIPTPGSATAEDCANKINELLQALRDRDWLDSAS